MAWAWPATCQPDCHTWPWVHQGRAETVRQKETQENQGRQPSAQGIGETDACILHKVQVMACWWPARETYLTLGEQWQGRALYPGKQAAEPVEKVQFSWNW